MEVDRRDGSSSPVRGTKLNLGEDSSSRRGSVVTLEMPGSAVTLHPSPKKLVTFNNTHDLDKNCERVSLATPVKSDLTEPSGESSGRPSVSVVAEPVQETYTLTLNNPDNFDYAISLLLTSSNLFEQVYMLISSARTLPSLRSIFSTIFIR